MGEDVDIVCCIWDIDNYILNLCYSYGCYLFFNYFQFDLMESILDDIWQFILYG